MKVLLRPNKIIFISLMGITFIVLSCQKATTAPNISGVAAFTVMNAIPNTVNGVIPVINTSQAIEWFQTANVLYYGGAFEYSPVGGNDTVYVVQPSDTLDIGPKALGQMYYGVIPLKKGSIYSLFLCGADTASPDYLFTIDSLPYHSSADSVTGIRFVNLSATSNPISINLEGSSNGSEVGNLPYKSITGFKNYNSNSVTSNSGYLFVFRDVITGDSLTSFSLSGNGIGLNDPNFGYLLTYKNVTIAFFGSVSNMNFPLSAALIENY